MTGLLIYREYAEKWFLPPAPTYENLIVQENLPSFGRMGIFSGEKRIGFSETLLEEMPDKSYRLTSDLEVTTAFLLQEAFIKSHMVLGFSQAKRLQNLKLNLGGSLKLDVTGEVSDGILRLAIRVGNQTLRQEYPFKADDLLVTSFEPFGPGGRVQRLRVGSRWTVQMLNPKSLDMDTVELKVVGKEEVSIEGKETPAYLVRMKMPGLAKELHSWVSPSGEVLKQETPFGFTLVRESVPQEAMSTRGDND